MDDLILFNIKSILSYIFKKIKIIFMIGIVFSAIIMSFLIIINKDKEKIYSEQNKKPLNSSIKFYNDLIEIKKTTKNKEVKNIISAYQDINCYLVGEFCNDNPYSKNFYNYDNLSFKLSSLLFFPFFNPPSSFIGWTKNTLSEAGFLPKTYAYEGIGFASLKPLISLWRIFRDFSFMIIVLVLVAIGFMIMFRTKINPQTVISVENSLPKIILALILVTFSFPIAGLIFDINNVLCILIIGLLSKNAIYQVDIEHYQQFFLNGQRGSLFNEIAIKNGFIILTGPAILNLGGWIFSLITKIIAGFIIIYLIKNNELIKQVTKAPEVAAGGTPVLPSFLTVISAIFKEGIIAVILKTLLNSIFTPLIISILIFFTGLYIYIKLLVMIFKAYITNLLLIIISPLLLTFEAIPGKNIFLWWVKSIFGNIIIYPIIIFIIIISNIIINSYNTLNISIPFLHTINPQDIAVLVSFGLVFLIPDFVNTVKESLGIKKSPINFGLGTLFMGAGAGLTGAQQTLAGLSSFGTNPLFGSTLFKLIPKQYRDMIIPQTLSTTNIKEFTDLLSKTIKTTTGVKTEDK